MPFWSRACEPCVLTIVPLASPSAHLHLLSPWWAFPAITTLWSLLHLPSQPGLSVKPPCCSEAPCPSCLLLNSMVSGLPCWTISSLKAGAIFCSFRGLCSPEHSIAAGQWWCRCQPSESSIIRNFFHPLKNPPHCSCFHWPQLSSRPVFSFLDGSWGLSYASSLW